MAFPITSVFEGIKGLVNLTITANAAGEPELIHFADEAGHACAHLALGEWEDLTGHISGMIAREIGPFPDVPRGGQLTDAPAPTTEPTGTAPEPQPTDAPEPEPEPESGA